MEIAKIEEEKKFVIKKDFPVSTRTTYKKLLQPVQAAITTRNKS
jgi:hypothetical protein